MWLQYFNEESSGQHTHFVHQYVIAVIHDSEHSRDVRFKDMLPYVLTYPLKKNQM